MVQTSLIFRTLVAIGFTAIFSFHSFANMTATEEFEQPEKELEDIDSVQKSFSVEDIEKLALTVLDTPPTLDGKLDDPFWAHSSVLSIDLEMYPTRFAKAQVKTDALIGVTNTHVYFAFHAYDPDMSKIRSAVRDEDGVKDDDYVSVVIDPTGNLRKKYEFRVNPHGSIADVLQNTVSDRYIYDWDTEWDAAAVRTKKSWIVEMGIPIDSLKQPEAAEGEKNQWALILKRSYPRQVDSTMGGIYIIEPPNPSSIQRIAYQREGETVLGDASRNLQVYPYAIYHASEKRGYGEKFVQRDEVEEFDGGIDFTMTVDNSTTFNATINPNFTDVEADIARDSINNPFNVFQPEKRRFFQDGMDLYSTLMPLVYTRNIIDPDLGLSFTHESKKYAMGAFWSDDKETEVIAPDNLGSDKVELDTLESRSMAGRYVTAAGGNAYGAMATYRSAGDYKNGVASVDGLWNLGLDDKLRYQVAFSETDYIPEFAEDLCEEDGCLEHDPDDTCELGSCDTNTYVQRLDQDDTIDGYAFQIKYKHTGPKSLFWANYFDVGKDFRGDLGFMRRVDYKLYNLAYGRNWYFETFSEDEGKSRGRVYLVATQIESQAGEKIETAYDLWGEFRGSYQTVFRPGYRIKERAVNRLEQDDLTLKGNAPKFDEKYFQWYFETAPWEDWVFNLDGRIGDIADADNIVLGKMNELKPRVRYQVGDFNIDFKYTLRKFDYENKKLYEEKFSTIVVNWRPDDQRIIRLLVKYDERDRDIDRWRGEELKFENDTEVEITHTRKLSKNLSFLTGFKLAREDDSDELGDYTDDRQFYFRVNYNFGFIGN